MDRIHDSIKLKEVSLSFKNKREKENGIWDTGKHEDGIQKTNQRGRETGGRLVKEMVRINNRSMEVKLPAHQEDYDDLLF